MSFLGTRLTILVGQTVPTPAPPSLVEAFESAEVTHNDQERSGFQVTFRVGRTSSDLLDYPLVSSPLLQPMNRVILLVTFNAFPQVLMDGIIADRQFTPGSRPGEGRLTINGMDVSVIMDLEERSVEHTAQPEAVIAAAIIARGDYARYGLIPMIIPPPSIDMPVPTERTPVQQVTDLQYLQEMAGRFGYVFYVTPGPMPGTNTAYWGPPIRTGMPQKALSINMGPNSNAEIPSFRYDALATTFVSGQVQDRSMNQAIPIQTFASTRPPLVSQPAWATQSQTRRRQMRRSGLNTAQAYARAQAETDSSTDRVVQVSGELDSARYEALLKPRGLVDLRGAGYAHDGSYYVKSVTHSISKGQYKQSFTLTREGVGALSPTVIP